MAPRQENSRVEEAYQVLKGRILSNQMPAGFQGFEPEIAASLGMSRTPVREALIRLEREGLVEVRPRRGVTVPALSADDLQEIYEVLTALEVAAARLWASRDWPERDGDLAALTQATDDMQAALDHQDRLSWARADDRFHTILLERCGNSRLDALARMVLDQSRRARMMTINLRPEPVNSTADHRALVTAIQDRDEELAGRIHEDHRRGGMGLIVDLIRSMSPEITAT